MLAEAAKFEQQYHAAGALEPGVDAMVRLVDARTSTSSVELQASGVGVWGGVGWGGDGVVEVQVRDGVGWGGVALLGLVSVLSRPGMQGHVHQMFVWYCQCYLLP